MRNRQRFPPWPVALVYGVWWLSFLTWIVISGPAQVASFLGGRYDPTHTWPAYVSWWQWATTVLVILTLLCVPITVARGIGQWRRGVRR